MPLAVQSRRVSRMIRTAPLAGVGANGAREGTVGDRPPLLFMFGSGKPWCPGRGFPGTLEVHNPKILSAVV